MFPSTPWQWSWMLSIFLAWKISLGLAELRVVCYYTNWSVYRPGTAKFSPQNINPYLCTHLIYAFGGFTKENALKPFDKYQDIEKGGYAKFTGLKTYNKNLKTMLAIGGWNEGSSRFSPMVANPERRKEFVKNAIKFLRQNHFDGLDLDWEYPSFRDGGKPRDKDNYGKLVQELREEFERESEKTGRPRLLLTMAVPAGLEYINKGYDVPKLTKYLDWMNILSYDYHSAFEPAVDHHSPLYALEEDSEYNFDSDLNIDHTIQRYLELGADPEKLVLGIPTYGRSYTLFNPDANDLGAPADGPGEMGDATRENGYLAYYEVCENVKEDEEWTVVQPNSDAMGPYAYKGNQWVGFDDEAIVKKKAQYVVEKKLGGIMFWSIDNDDFRGVCHGKPYPLIEAGKEALLAAAGLTDDNLIPSSEKPVKVKPRTRRPTISHTTESVKDTDAGTRKRLRTKEPIANKDDDRPAKRRRIKPGSSTKQVNSVISTTGSSLTLSKHTPEPPTTPDPGGDFKCEDEGFFPHPRDCKKYFWCLSSGPSELGIVAHQFTCPSGLYFNKAADSCDYTQNVLCNKKLSKAKSTAATTSSSTLTTTTTTSAPVSTTRAPPKITAATSRTTLYSTPSTTAEYEEEYEYEDEEDLPKDSVSDAEEDPRVIKELLELIKKAGGIEELEKQLNFQTDGTSSVTSSGSTTPTTISKSLYERVLNRATGRATSSPKETKHNRGPQYDKTTEEQEDTRKRVKPQYSSIPRHRPSVQTKDEEEDDAVITTPKNRKITHPDYVTIRRSRPSTTPNVDTNASESITEESIENDKETDAHTHKSFTPEYVTLSRRRPTTEEIVSTEKYTETDRATTLSGISQSPEYVTLRRRPTTLEQEITTTRYVTIRERPSTDNRVTSADFNNDIEVNVPTTEANENNIVLSTGDRHSSSPSTVIPETTSHTDKTITTTFKTGTDTTTTPDNNSQKFTPQLLEPKPFTFSRRTRPTLQTTDSPPTTTVKVSESKATLSRPQTFGEDGEIDKNGTVVNNNSQNLNEFEDANNEINATRRRPTYGEIRRHQTTERTNEKGVAENLEQSNTILNRTVHESLEGKTDVVNDGKVSLLKNKITLRSKIASNQNITPHGNKSINSRTSTSRPTRRRFNITTPHGNYSEATTFNTTTELPQSSTLGPRRRGSSRYRPQVHHTENKDHENSLHSENLPLDRKRRPDISEAISDLSSLTAADIDIGRTGIKAGRRKITRKISQFNNTDQEAKNVTQEVITTSRTLPIRRRTQNTALNTNRRLGVDQESAIGRVQNRRNFVRQQTETNNTNPISNESDKSEHVSVKPIRKVIRRFRLTSTTSEPDRRPSEDDTSTTTSGPTLKINRRKPFARPFPVHKQINSTAATNNTIQELKPLFVTKHRNSRYGANRQTLFLNRTSAPAVKEVTDQEVKDTNQEERYDNITSEVIVPVNSDSQIKLTVNGTIPKSRNILNEVVNGTNSDVPAGEDEEEENIKLSETIISENDNVGKIHLNDFRDPNEKPRRKVIKRIKGVHPIFHDKDTPIKLGEVSTESSTLYDTHINQYSTTDPSRAIRTRKIIRKFPTTKAISDNVEPSSTSNPSKGRTRKIVRRLKPTSVADADISVSTESIVHSFESEKTLKITKEPFIPRRFSRPPYSIRHPSTTSSYVDEEDVEKSSVSRLNKPRKKFGVKPSLDNADSVAHVASKTVFTPHKSRFTTYRRTSPTPQELPRELTTTSVKPTTSSVEITDTTVVTSEMETTTNDVPPSSTITLLRETTANFLGETTLDSVELTTLELSTQDVPTTTDNPFEVSLNLTNNETVTTTNYEYNVTKEAPTTAFTQSLLLTTEIPTTTTAATERSSTTEKQNRYSGFNLLRSRYNQNKVTRNRDESEEVKPTFGRNRFGNKSVVKQDDNVEIKKTFVPTRSRFRSSVKKINADDLSVKAESTSEKTTTSTQNIPNRDLVTPSTVENISTSTEADEGSTSTVQQLTTNEIETTPITTGFLFESSTATEDLETNTITTSEIQSTITTESYTSTLNDNVETSNVTEAADVKETTTTRSNLNAVLFNRLHTTKAPLKVTTSTNQDNNEERHDKESQSINGVQKILRNRPRIKFTPKSNNSHKVNITGSTIEAKPINRPRISNRFNSRTPTATANQGSVKKYVYKPHNRLNLEEKEITENDKDEENNGGEEYEEDEDFGDEEDEEYEGEEREEQHPTKPLHQPNRPVFGSNRINSQSTAKLSSTYSTKPPRRFIHRGSSTIKPTLNTVDGNTLLKNSRNRLFNKTRVINTPFPGVPTSSLPSTIATSPTTVSDIFSTTEESEEMTTEPLVTLQHVFSQTEPSTLPTTAEASTPFTKEKNSSGKNDTVERLIEVNRIVQVSLKEAKLSHNASVVNDEINLDAGTVDRVGAITRVTHIKIIDKDNDTVGLSNETLSTTSQGTTESSPTPNEVVSDTLETTASGTSVNPSSTPEETATTTHVETTTRKASYEIYSRGKVVFYEEKPKVNPNQVLTPQIAQKVREDGEQKVQILDGRSIVHTFTPKPLFAPEATTIPLEALFHKDMKNDELLQTDTAQYVRVRILGEEHMGRSINLIPADETATVRILPQDELPTIKAEVMEIMPRSSSQMIKIAPPEFYMQIRDSDQVQPADSDIEESHKIENIQFISHPVNANSERTSMVFPVYVREDRNAS